MSSQRKKRGILLCLDIILRLFNHMVLKYGFIYIMEMGR